MWIEAIFLLLLHRLAQSKRKTVHCLLKSSRKEVQGHMGVSGDLAGQDTEEFGVKVDLIRASSKGAELQRIQKGLVMRQLYADSTRR